MATTREICKKKSHDLLTMELETGHLKYLEQHKNKVLSEK